MLDSTLSRDRWACASSARRAAGRLEPTPRLRLSWRTPLEGLVAARARRGTYLQFPGDRLEADPTIGNPNLQAERARHLAGRAWRATLRRGRAALARGLSQAPERPDRLRRERARRARRRSSNTGAGTATRHRVPRARAAPERGTGGWRTRWARCATATSRARPSTRRRRTCGTRSRSWGAAAVAGLVVRREVAGPERPPLHADRGTRGRVRVLRRHRLDPGAGGVQQRPFPLVSPARRAGRACVSASARRTSPRRSS